MTDEYKNSLLDSQSGDQVKIIRMNLAGEDIIRLAGLGLVDGAVIKVMKNNGRGPVIIKIKQTRLALGHNEAKSIFTQVI